MSISQTIKRMVWLLSVSVVLILVGIYLILIASGYKINYKNWHLEKQGMIYLKSEPKDVLVYLNNKSIATGTPLQQELFPGRYDLVVEKTHYQTWRKTVYVESGLVNRLNYLVLFLAQPKEIELSKEEQEKYQRLFTSSKPDNYGLYIKNDYEIWFSDVLVTRLSTAIKNLIWYSDKKHLIFQVHKEIRIIDPDSANNLKLIDLDNEEKVDLMINDKGESLIYRSQDNIVKKYKIK